MKIKYETNGSKTPELLEFEKRIERMNAREEKLLNEIAAKLKAEKEKNDIQLQNVGSTGKGC
jgi:hypothetical protein